eukprot:3549082-Rhodomonas_salina.1
MYRNTKIRYVQYHIGGYMPQIAFLIPPSSWAPRLNKLASSFPQLRTPSDTQPLQLQLLRFREHRRAARRSTRHSRALDSGERIRTGPGRAISRFREPRLAVRRSTCQSRALDS